MSRLRGSASSVISDDEMEYVSTEESERREIRVCLGKRKSRQEETERSDEDGSEGEGERVMKEARKGKERKVVAAPERKGRSHLVQQVEERRKEMSREAELLKEGVVGEKEDEMGAKFKVIQGGLSRIGEAVSREVGGKLSVTRGDQAVVRETLLSLYREFFDVIIKQREMEGENNKLRKELEECKRGQPRGIMAGESREGDWQEVRRGRGQRVASYAGAVRRGVESDSGSERGKIEGRVVVAGKKGWKTPPLSRGEEEVLVVTKKEEKNARKLAEELASTIRGRDIGGPPKAVRTIRDGKLIIVSKDKEQGGKIRESLGKIKDVEAREVRKVEPLLMISGVEKGLGEEELIGKIVRGCDSEAVRMGEIKIVRRVGCRNAWKENVIIRVGQDGFKYMVKRGKIEIDCVLHYVEEYLGLAMCFRCCGYGHTTRFCAGRETCYKCGGGHDSRMCEERERKCINCWRVFGERRGHEARDGNCPAFQKALMRSRRNINY